MKELTKEELKAWMLDPTTAEVVERVTDEIADCMASIVEGATLGTTSTVTIQNTADAVGYIRGLRYFLNIKGDDTKEGE